MRNVLIFRYGYMTWEWTNGIRNYIHPVLISGLYKVMQLLNVNCSCLYALVPRLAQALLTAFSDYRLHSMSGKTKWSFFIILVSHFWFYTGSRTLINTFEATLTTIALSYYPWHKERSCYLWIVGLLCIIRPTAAIPWIPLCLWHIKDSKYSALELIAKRFVPIGVVTIGLGIAVDYVMYGDLVLTPVNFFKANVLNNIGSFYGTHPWYWYLTQGWPVVMGICIVPFVLSAANVLTGDYTPNLPIRQKLLTSILFTIGVYSLFNHKEFRFLLPVLPMAMFLVADYLARVSRKLKDVFVWFIAITLLVGNVVPAWYLGLVHQRGTLDVMPQLSKLLRTTDEKDPSITFLMPCHSTPYYSHLHQNVTMNFLTCEPNLKNATNYKDEAELFYEEPMKWIEFNIPIHPIEEMPKYVVMFDVLEPRILQFLSIYKRILTIPHAEVVSNCVQGSMVVQCNNRSSLYVAQVSSERVGRNVLVFERFSPSVIQETIRQSETASREDRAAHDDDEL